MPADLGRLVHVHRRTRGRSREQTPHRRPHRHACSESRTTAACSKSPSPRLRCKSPDFSGSNANNHHPSPSPPKVRANQSQFDDQPFTPTLSASPTWKPNTPPDATALSKAAPPSNSSSESLTTAVTLSCLNVLQDPPVSDHDNATQQRSHLAAERRFRTGRVYSRRPCVPPPHTGSRHNRQEAPRWCGSALGSSTPDAAPMEWSPTARAVDAWQMAYNSSIRARPASVT